MSVRHFVGPAAGSGGIIFAPFLPITNPSTALVETTSLSFPICRKLIVNYLCPGAVGRLTCRKVSVLTAYLQVLQLTTVRGLTDLHPYTTYALTTLKLALTLTRTLHLSFQKWDGETGDERVREKTHTYKHADTE